MYVCMYCLFPNTTLSKEHVHSINLYWKQEMEGHIMTSDTIPKKKIIFQKIRDKNTKNIRTSPNNHQSYAVRNLEKFTEFSRCLKL